MVATYANTLLQNFHRCSMYIPIFSVADVASAMILD